MDIVRRSNVRRKGIHRGIATVKRGPLMREMRGLGMLVPENIRWIPATIQGRVERIISLDSKSGEVVMDLP